jgi:hypothetical protein
MQQEWSMARGPAVPVKGIWLYRSGDHVIVSAEDEHGNNVELIREWFDGPFSHNISEHGIAGRFAAFGKEKA